MRSFKAALLFSFLFSFSATYAQQDSCHLKVSLLTCGPGEDLYSIFGHSAIRITDTVNRTDIIYNYGTFDFEDPDFYVKFVRGKLLYYVSAETFRNFMYAYQVEKRFVIEQTLSLTCSEKQNLFAALRTNALEENKYYLYQFLFDNCSTRLRDMLKNAANDSVHIRNILPATAPSFRNILHVYFEGNGHYWSEFGVDLLLGSRIDRKMRNEEVMFLPDYLMKGFDSTVVRNTSLVSSKETILPAAADKEKEGMLITPLVFNIFVFVLGTALLFVRNRRINYLFDAAFFFILGFIGLFILFMWFGTDHELCRDNYNLLWTIPTHVVFAFLTDKKNRLVKNYFGITVVIAVLILVSWSFFPQGMNYAFIPMILLSAVRGGYRAFNR